MQFKRFHTLAVLGGTLLLSCSSFAGTPSKLDIYGRAIEQMGGKIVNVGAFPVTVAGFQQYLLATGVKAVSAVEMTTPNHPAVAAKLGFQAFLPPQSWWSRGAALALLTQAMETATKTTAHLRNWWRPAAYNTDPAVKGARNGDHPTANALDLDYASAGDRMKAESFFRRIEKQFPWMQLSFGFGAQTTHIGLASPRGHREWHYGGWSPAIAADGD